MIRVLLADDQALLRHGFSLIINAEADMTVIGEAANGRDAAALAGSLRPDVVLMDVRMPGGDGISATREIIDTSPEVKVLVLTTFDLDEYAFAALRAGASGFLLKSTQPAELISHLRTVAAGDAVIAPSTTRRLLDRYAHSFDEAAPEAAGSDVLAPLTAREREVFAELAAGRTNHEIAARLVLSETTVKTHVARVLAKLHLRDRVHVVIFSHRNRLPPG